MMSTPDDNKQVDVGEGVVDDVKSPSRGNLEESLSVLDDIFQKKSDIANKDGSEDCDKDLVSTSSGSVSKRLARGLLGRVSKFNANPTDANLLSPMQSLKKTRRKSTFDHLPQIKLSPVARKLHPNEALKTRIKNYEGNTSGKALMTFDLRSPQDVKKLVKSSRDNNQKLDEILNRYEHLTKESQQRRELASKVAARERHRRQGCTKSEEERAVILKENRARLFRSGSERILDTDVSDQLNGGENGKVTEAVSAVPCDFSNFVPPSFQKTGIQRTLILGVIERSFVFAEFRKYGKARCDGALEMLVDAFEPVSFPPGHILLDPGVKKENDEFYVLERGRIDFKKDGRPVAEVAKVGGYFEELALLHNSECERMISVCENTTRQARLLKINQKTFRGILNTCSKQAAQEKRDALLNVDILSELIKENEDMIRRLSSIMIREEMETDEIFSLSQNDTFIVIRSGRIHVPNSNEIFEPGDYFGSRNLVRTYPKQGIHENDTVACFDDVVFFRIEKDAMEQIVGPSRLQNLMDMGQFAATGLIEKANLSNDAYEDLADTIHEKKLCDDEEGTWEINQNDPPAVYVVREGSLVVSSHDKSSGSQIETIVTEGNVFGLEQLQVSDKNGRPMYRRDGGLKASIPSGQSASIGVLPLEEVKLNAEYTGRGHVDRGEDKDDASKIKWRDSVSLMLQLRSRVREFVDSKISLDDLEKIRLLGEGEFGEVWLVASNVFCADSLPTKQMFALKSQVILDDSRGMDATDVILREIEIMKELRHPQLVDLVNTYQDETCIHMLMRLIPYGELWDRMHTEDDQGNWSSGLPDDHAKFYAMSIADTLNFMHSKGIIYRDLKPENILIDIDGYPVFVDFGFAKVCPDKTYTFVGTPNYVAPEIITNAGHNRAADWWSFGVTLYEMVTGENPFFFEGVDQVSLYHSICHDKYFPLPEDQNKEFVDILNKLLKKDPVERLGMLHGGINDILQHKWFHGIELTQIQTKSFPAPWKPAELIYDGFENLQLDTKFGQMTDSSFLTNDSVASSASVVPAEERGEVQEIDNSSRSKMREVQESIGSLSSIVSADETGEQERSFSSISKMRGVQESIGSLSGIVSEEESGEQDLSHSSRSKMREVQDSIGSLSSIASAEETGEVQERSHSSRYKMRDSIGSLSSIVLTEEAEEIQDLSNSSRSKLEEEIEPSISSKSKTKKGKKKSRKLKSKKPTGDIEDSIGSLSHIVLTEEAEEIQDSSNSSISKSGEESKTAKRKKKSRKLNSKKPISNNLGSGSGSNSYDDPSEFQFVSLLDRVGPIRNPNIRKTQSQKKQSKMRRDLLQNSLNNLGIE